MSEDIFQPGAEKGPPSTVGFREDVSNSLQMGDTLALLHNSRKLFFLVLYLGAKPALRDGRFLVHRSSGWTVET